MGDENRGAGIVLLCDAQGNVVEIVRDDLGVMDQALVGRPLSLVVDRASYSKALGFLAELGTHGEVFDWPLNVSIAGEVATLHFAGAVGEDRSLIVGARTGRAIRQICAELTVEGEQIEPLRAAVARCAESAQSRIEEDDALYDELSRLNNELVTLQRELAKKNVELETLYAQVQRHALELEERVEERTAELQASEARFRALFEQAAIGIALFEPGGRLLDSNQALQEMVGCSAEELCDGELWQFAPGSDSGKHEEVYRGISSGQHDHQKLEQRFARKDGQPGWANITLSLVRGPAGQARFVIGMVEDITEQKIAQEALLRAEKLAIAGRLAASLAHEINNPLQTVIGCLALAQEALAEGEDTEQLFPVALEELRRVARIVADLRTLHQPPRMEEKEPVDVNALLEQTLTLSRKKCEEHRVKVAWHPAEGLPALLLVPDRVQQVFLNLVLNALDAMPDGGQLDVRTEHTAQPPGVRITFADSGMGIPADLLPHIFEPFRTSKPEGLGLGLFISEDIARRHGGRIEVESHEGSGTAFAVWLPA